MRAHAVLAAAVIAAALIYLFLQSQSSSAKKNLREACTSIADNDLGVMCSAVFYREPLDCRRVYDDSSRDWCYRAVARVAKDSDICSRITDRGGIDQCYIDLAIKNRDRDLCDRISEQNDINWCYATLKGDGAYCRNIQDNEGQKAECLAITAADTGACDGINDQWRKTDCYRELAITKKDTPACDKIDADDERAWCKTLVAIIRTDHTICLGIGEQEHKARCIAVVNKDPAVCDEITDKAMRDNCLWNVVAAERDYYNT